MSAILTLKGEWIAAPEAEIPGLADWLAAPGPAVQLASHEDPVPLLERGGALELVLIDFPRFTDGRGYSLAVELRRAGYRGELRAVGEVLIDQVFLMKRVGFTQFALRADQDRALAVAALTRYSEAYQGAVDEPLPIYRRHSRPVQAAPGGA
jgi:uncharacterized protein (DUF934 family)